MTDAFEYDLPNAGSVTSNDKFRVLKKVGSVLESYNLTPADLLTYLNANITFPVAPYSQGYLFGLTLANNGSDATNDIDIATGRCRSSDNGDNMILASALTKRLDAAWAVGTNQGGLDTGSIANTTYHVWLIKRSDTGVVDVLFSTSATSPTMPTNYNYKRRIGSFVRGGGVIKPFLQDGDKFIWKTPICDVNATNPGTSAVTRTLTVPIGIRVEAIIGVQVLCLSGGAAGDYPAAVYISDLSLDDIAPSDVAGFTGWSYLPGVATGGTGTMATVFTNTSGQVRSRVQQSTAQSNFKINTHGWVDTRGRLS